MRALGYNSLFINDLGKIRQLRMGYAAPSLKYDRNSRDTVEGWVTAHYDRDEDVFELIDGKFVWIEGVTPQIYTSEQYFDRRDAYIYYVDPGSVDEIFRFLKSGRLKYSRDGAIYRRLSLFLANPVAKENEFIVALLNLISGAEI